MGGGVGEKGLKEREGKRKKERYGGGGGGERQREEGGEKDRQTELKE